MATYAIGDVQGCADTLKQLVRHIGFNSLRDRLWFVGDLVNRGPDSLGVLRYVRSLGSSAVTVLGNHDLHLLAIAGGVARPGKKDTIHQVLNAPDRDELLSWLCRQPLLYRENNVVLIHAGLLPQWTVATAAKLAQEVEGVLRGEHYRELLRGLYVERFPDHWDEHLPGPARLGVITNALTKLRVCTPTGRMDLGFKAEPQHIPPGLLPWFIVPGRRSTGETIICGHWSALGLHLQDNVMAIDTGCVWGRLLTAVRLEDRRVFQVASTM